MRQMTASKWMMMRTIAMLRMVMVMMKMMRMMMTNLASAASLRETVLSSVEKLSAKRSLVTWRTDAADDHDHYADDQKPPKKFCGWFP